MVDQETIKISSILELEKNEVLDICVEVFKNVMPQASVKGYINCSADWDLSVKATFEDKIVGCYILNENQIPIPFKSIRYFNDDDSQWEDLSKYAKLKGIEGIALAVLPEYRDKGIGKALRNYPLTLDYDYIWGQHYESLQNIQHWVKFGRRIVSHYTGLYRTLMDIKDNNDLNKTDHETLDFNTHCYQQQGHTCGPTCVKMVADFLNVSYKDINELIELCECNTTTGTIDTGIKNALDALGIPNSQNKITDPAIAMEFLDDLLLNNNIFVMRTLTHGAKHWIIVYGKENDKYLIADPWLGKIQYSHENILSIWWPRNFDGFLVNI